MQKRIACVFFESYSVSINRGQGLGLGAERQTELGFTGFTSFCHWVAVLFSAVVSPMALCAPRLGQAFAIVQTSAIGANDGVMGVAGRIRVAEQDCLTVFATPKTRIPPKLRHLFPTLARLVRQ